MAVGGIIALVVFSLFITREISIFSKNEIVEGVLNQDYWRVVILCLVAGAFSDRLYDFAAAKLETISNEVAPAKGTGEEPPREEPNDETPPEEPNDEPPPKK